MSLLAWQEKSILRDPPFHIVVVEDNEDDVLILSRALAATGEDIRLHRARDGRELSDALLRHHYPGESEGATTWPPDLILVDLGLPGVSGFAVIELMQAESSLQDVPIIVLSGSDDPKDQQRGSELGINTQIRKPIRVSELSWMIESVRSFREKIGRINAIGALAGS
jgi:CheY-like chemotaxis protein